MMLPYKVHAKCAAPLPNRLDHSFLEIDVETLELPPLPEHIQALLTPKYRLVINKIEINNFKSFAGRIQLDQFDEVSKTIRAARALIVFSQC